MLVPKIFKDNKDNPIVINKDVCSRVGFKHCINFRSTDKDLR